MGMKVRSSALPIGVQAINLSRMYRGSALSAFRDIRLRWTHVVTPSPFGDRYSIRLTYKVGQRPQVFVTDPNPLSKPAGADTLPHCYDQTRQRLCLYYPDQREWNKSMLLARTIVPWAYEWLYHYEIWRCNGGNWTGGGIHLGPGPHEI